MKNKAPISPVIIVTSNWLMLPIAVTKIPSQKLAFFKMKILPKKSPILLGANVLTVMPHKTALYDWKNEMFSIFPIRYFHFQDSIPQLMNMSRRINARKLKKEKDENKSLK